MPFGESALRRRSSPGIRQSGATREAAIQLPPAARAGRSTLRNRQPDSGSLRRYDEVAQLLTGSDTATALDGVAWIQQLCEQLSVPPLSSYGLTESDFPDLIEKSMRASSMKGNPIELQRDELHEVLHRAL